MATMVQRINSLITTIKNETKAIRTLISGSATGNVSGLTTTANDLVGAINEVKSAADSAGGSNLTIDDGVQNATNAWSSNKIKSEITADIANALEGEDISDLAAQVAANAAADNSLVSFSASQTLTAAQITQVGANIGIGEPDTDFVAVWNAA